MNTYICLDCKHRFTGFAYNCPNCNSHKVVRLNIKK